MNVMRMEKETTTSESESDVPQSASALQNAETLQIKGIIYIIVKSLLLYVFFQLLSE